LIVAQTMVLICAVCGLALFLYVHAFSYRRLRHQERSLDREDTRSDRADAAARPGTQLAIDAAPLGAPTRDALFYLYHEQVRRFLDAKIDIMRSAAETQNRILLMQAEVVRDTGKEATPPMLEMRPGGDCELAIPPRRDGAALLGDQLSAARRETERHLSEIDRQIRALPGPSLDRWVAAQAGQSAD